MAQPYSSNPPCIPLPSRMWLHLPPRFSAIQAQGYSHSFYLIRSSPQPLLHNHMWYVCKYCFGISICSAANWMGQALPWPIFSYVTGSASCPLLHRAKLSAAHFPFDTITKKVRAPIFLPCSHWSQLPWEPQSPASTHHQIVSSFSQS